MHTEDLLVDERGYGQAVEAVGEGLPNLDIVSALACMPNKNFISHRGDPG